MFSDLWYSKKMTDQFVGVVGRARATGIGPLGQPDAGERVEGLADGVEEDGKGEEGQAHVGDVVHVDGEANPSSLHFLSFVLDKGGKA